MCFRIPTVATLGAAVDDYEVPGTPGPLGHNNEMAHKAAIQEIFRDADHSAEGASPVLRLLSWASFLMQSVGNRGA